MTYARLVAVLTIGVVIGALCTVFATIQIAPPAPRAAEPDTRPARAYAELADVIRDNQHDGNSAHARIDALVWQMHVVARSCPGRARPPDPPWPVLRPLERPPWVPKEWRLLR